jgi:hypothetical protein
MKSFEIHLDEIPHGHGLSFNRGIADVLLDIEENKNDVPKTHLASYRKGFEVGVYIKENVAYQVN